MWWPQSSRAWVCGCQKWQTKVALSSRKRALGTLHRVPTEVVRKSMRCLEKEEMERKGIPQPGQADTGEELAGGMTVHTASCSRPRSL